MSATLLISESPEMNIALEIQISHRYELSIKTTTKIVIKNGIKIKKQIEIFWLKSVLKSRAKRNEKWSDFWFKKYDRKVCFLFVIFVVKSVS
ncbi:hypothetical protein CGJ42_24240 [Vibrio parahaemolyticus]|nr:hypothetical protein CGJ42_24240 [Vibrio parahaemolyticus]